MALPREAAMQRLVADIAGYIEPGDLITLSGDLGAGKTTFARALIRTLADNPAIEVPSPTFTLLQAYDLPRFPLVHADLYRVTAPGELAELGFEDLPPTAAVLLEWPDRAPGILPPNRLDIELKLAPQRGLEYRDVRITGHGACAARAMRLAALRRFLEEAGFAEAGRRRLAGDASTRSYERLTLGDRRLVLMNAPRRPDGPPVKDGLPYSAIAHLAEDVKAFVALDNGLRQHGLSAPEIFAADLDNGFLVLEDLGSEGVVEGEPPSPIADRYAAAVDVLAALHGLDLPAVLPVAPGIDHPLPEYDEGAFTIEVELLLDWYLPRFRMTVAEELREEYRGLWREALAPALAAPKTWVLRDYHSPNLLWLPARDGVACIGLLDFQDAVMGPAAYDVASLLQDARVDVPEALELDLVTRYVGVRRSADQAFDTPGFAQLYATLAAQRASKILGIFARLDKRDGKPQYLRHLPRVYAYLQRALAHPTLTALKIWYDLYVPPPK
jgi:tRNA threonylcarbamoyl adenosine modification protein YjeE